MATDKLPTTEKPKKFASSVAFLTDGMKSKAMPKKMVAVKVRATRLGYYDLKLRQEGDVFVVQVNTASKDRDGMLPSWVEAVNKTEIPTAPIPETQETAHLRGGDSSETDEGSESGESGGAGSGGDQVI